MCVFFLSDVDPKQPGLPGPGQLVAQNSESEDEAATDNAGGKERAATSKSAASVHKPIDFVVAGEVVTPAFLNDPTVGEFVETPLGDVARFLSEYHNVPIMLDVQSVEEEGLSTDTPVTLSVSSFPKADKKRASDEEGEATDSAADGGSAVTLQQGLDWITRQYHLEWYIDEGIVRITSEYVEEERQVSRSYFIRQFLVDGFNEHSLVETIQEMTRGQWEDIDGAGGTLALVGDVLTIRQNWQTHRKIEALLGSLLRREKEAHIQYSADSLRLKEQLEQRVEHVDFEDAPLSDLVTFLSEVSGLRIHIDKEALSEEGVSTDTPVSLELKNQSVRTILRLALKPLLLQAIIHEGRLEITNASRAEEILTTVVYDVRDLDDGVGQLKQLQEAIESTSSGPWINRDGSGGTLLMPGGGRMVVRQTTEGHREIRQLLIAQRRAATIGKTFDSTGAELTRSTEVIRTARRGPLEKRFYRVPSETADDLLKVLPESIEPDSWNKVAMFGQGKRLEVSVGMIAKVEAGQKVVKITDPDGKPANGKKSGTAKGNNSGNVAQPKVDVLVVPEAVLIIDQTPAVHQKIEQFLQRLDLDVKGVSLEEATNGGGGMGGGGFF